MTETHETDLARLKESVRSLSEHFDTVHLFVTRYEGGDAGGTLNLSHGDGNWFARRGQIQEWLTKAEEEARQIVKRREEE